MKTDSIFYRLFKELPSSFFELIGLSDQESNQYKFESIELKQTSFRIDGVFLPKIENSSIPTYFTEVQFQKDEELYGRLFSEIFLYLRLNGCNLPWHCVVIFKNSTVEPKLEYQQAYSALLNSTFVTKIYLNELKITESTPVGLKIIHLIVAKKKEIADNVKMIIEEVKQKVNNQKIEQQVINLIETIVIYKLPQISRKELETMLGIEDLRKTRFAQEMITEGKLEGKIEGKLEAVPRLLAKGFSIEETAEILGLTFEQVNNSIKSKKID